MSWVFSDPAEIISFFSETGCSVWSDSARFTSFQTELRSPVHLNSQSALKRDHHNLTLNSILISWDYLPVTNILVAGGGSKSALWNKIKSDVLGAPLRKLSRGDLTLLGDIILAGNGIGMFPDLSSTVENFMTKDEPITPDEDCHNQYKTFIGLYSSLMEKLKPFFRELKD